MNPVKCVMIVWVIPYITLHWVFQKYYGSSMNVIAFAGIWKMMISRIYISI